MGVLVKTHSLQPPGTFFISIVFKETLSSIKTIEKTTNKKYWVKIPPGRTGCQIDVWLDYIFNETSSWGVSYFSHNENLK